MLLLCAARQHGLRQWIISLIFENFGWEYRPGRGSKAGQTESSVSIGMGGCDNQYRGVALAESYLREPRSTSSAVRSIRTGASLRIEPETNWRHREAFRIPIPDWEPR